MTTYVIILILTTSYCFVRGGVDLWKRRYVWGALGLATGVLILASATPAGL